MTIMNHKQERHPCAYNIFFYLECDRMLDLNMMHTSCSTNDEENYYNCSVEDMQRAALAIRCKPKRKHKKLHHTINLHELSANICVTWKTMDSDMMIGLQLQQCLWHLQQQQYQLQQEKVQLHIPSSLSTTSMSTTTSSVQQQQQQQRRMMIQQSMMDRRFHDSNYDRTMTRSGMTMLQNTNSTYNDSRQQ
jgi:hypothetical protein